jgi:hypothetical protein
MPEIRYQGVFLGGSASQSWFQSPPRKFKRQNKQGVLENEKRKKQHYERENNFDCVQALLNSCDEKMMSEIKNPI